MAQKKTISGVEIPGKEVEQCKKEISSELQENPSGRLARMPADGQLLYVYLTRVAPQQGVDALLSKHGAEKLEAACSEASGYYNVAVTLGCSVEDAKILCYAYGEKHPHLISKTGRPNKGSLETFGFEKKSFTAGGQKMAARAEHARKLLGLSDD